MSLFNIFKDCSSAQSDSTNELWDDSLEEISLGEQIRYKIASKFSTIKSGEYFGIENVFGDSFSPDEYMEFIKFANWYSGPQIFQTQEEFETALKGNTQDCNILKKIANTYIAIGEPEKSTEWFKKAASEGDAEAMTR